ncbi:MAG: TIGR03621 family F420-dependent LLM class oxidoreductase [Actinobacteria bacterium]|nr:MAG: TIGR03621 family F420-dependent LLM class oxidoreductase [Actinomycetota bacterium]
MAHDHRFRFGVHASGLISGKEWADLARRVEDLGYSTMTLPDHFGNQMAPMPALMAAASATSTLRIGALVWDNDYKHPVVLAKELATMDLLSDGRVEVGIGAGWERADYDWAGIPYDPPGVRVDRLEEGLAIIKGLFGPGPFSFTGQHYTVSGLDGLPKPVQEHVPLLVGGGGKRVLSIAAREADIVGINASLAAGAIGPEALASMTPDAVDEKVAIVKLAAGPRFADLEMNIRSFIVSVTDDREGLAARLASGFGMTPKAALETPFALAGTVEQIVETLQERRERWGFSYIIVGSGDVEPFAPVVAALAGT